MRREAAAFLFSRIAQKTLCHAAAPDAHAGPGRHCSLSRWEAVINYNLSSVSERASDIPEHVRSSRLQVSSHHMPPLRHALQRWPAAAALFRLSVFIPPIARPSERAGDHIPRLYMCSFFRASFFALCVLLLFHSCLSWHRWLFFTPG